MNSFNSEFFFSLAQFSHRELFKEKSFVWDALKELDSYFEKQIIGKIEVELSASVHLMKKELISIGLGTIVEPGVYIQGPAIIGLNNIIRHGAYIRGGVITGEGCVIGHGTEVKRSIFLNRAQAAHFNYVGDSILGNDVNLGAGVKTANLRLDRQEVFIFYRGKKIKTGLKKFGVIMGDGAQIGCNSVTNPGALIGRGVCCHPCVSIKGFLSSQSLYTEES